MLIGSLETERLRLRSFRPDDWKAVYAYASDVATNIYLREGEVTKEETRAWVLHERSRGQGYATEAARALLGYGVTTLGLHRVTRPASPKTSPPGESWRGLGCGGKHISA